MLHQGAFSETVSVVRTWKKGKQIQHSNSRQYFEAFKHLNFQPCFVLAQFYPVVDQDQTAT